MSALRLERALIRSAAQAGAAIQVETHRLTAWHSATFSGDRHELVAYAASGERLDGWLGRLDPSAMKMPGALLAELRVAGREQADGVTRFTIEGTTLATD